MARKVVSVAKSKTKQKQKQKQSQKVIVNINSAKEKRVYSKSKLTKEETKQGKTFLPITPSFNINQPTPQNPSQSTDLAKILGMLIPKLQTESTLGSAISTPTQIPTSTKENIGGLINKKETPSFIDAINAVKKEPLSEAPLENIYQEPESEFEYVNEDIKRLSRLKKVVNPYYESEAEVKPKRKYTKSGKYSKKQPKEFSEFQKE